MRTGMFLHDEPSWIKQSANTYGALHVHGDCYISRHDCSTGSRQSGRLTVLRQDYVKYGNWQSYRAGTSTIKTKTYKHHRSVESFRKDHVNHPPLLLAFDETSIHFPCDAQGRDVKEGHEVSAQAKMRQGKSCRAESVHNRLPLLSSAPPLQ